MIDWVLVRQAAAIEPTNALAAELLLKQAMGCDTEKPGCGGCDSNCCGGNVTLVEKQTTEQAVIYGKGGMAGGDDPRQESARGHKQDANGKIIGMHVNVHVLPNTLYRCTNVAVISEEASKGQTVCFVSVKNKNGQVAANERVVLATGYNGEVDKWDAILDPGNGNIPVQHMLSGAGFNPPNLGPLAVFVADSQGKPISDVVANLGLPYKRHVNVVIELQER